MHTNTLILPNLLPISITEQTWRSTSTIDWAYFLIDAHPHYDSGGEIDSLLQTLVNAAHRGVRVRVMLKNTSKDNYTASIYASNRLIQGGVAVRWYNGSLEDYHGKIAVFDGKKAIIGSTNLSPTGVWISRDLSLMSESPKVVDLLNQEFQEIWESSDSSPNGGYPVFPDPRRVEATTRTILSGFTSLSPQIEKLIRSIVWEHLVAGRVDYDRQLDLSEKIKPPHQGTVHILSKHLQGNQDQDVLIETLKAEQTRLFARRKMRRLVHKTRLASAQARHAHEVLHLLQNSTVADNSAATLLKRGEYHSTVMRELRLCEFKIVIIAPKINFGRRSRTNAFLDALVKAHHRGIGVEILLGAKPNNGQKDRNAHVVSWLRSEGIHCSRANSDEIHGTTIIFDSEKTIIGSHHLTARSQFRVADYSVLVKSREISTAARHFVTTGRNKSLQPIINTRTKLLFSFGGRPITSKELDASATISKKTGLPTIICCLISMTGVSTLSEFQRLEWNNVIKKLRDVGFIGRHLFKKVKEVHGVR